MSNGSIKYSDTVFFGTLAEFSALHPLLAAQYTERLKDNEYKYVGEKNVFLRQPTFKGYFDLDFSGRTVLYVPKNSEKAKVEISLKTLNGFRCILIVDEGASFEMFIDGTDLTKGDSLIEVYMLKNSKAEIVTINTNSSDFESFVLVEQGAQSVFKAVTVSIGVENFGNSIKCLLNEPTAEAQLYGVTFASDNDSVRNSTIMAHIASDCRSEQQYKAVVGDSAKSLFNGVVYVAVGAQKTEAYQQSNNIVLNDGATARNLPQLEIYADDVKCSHGATTGELDEEVIFYMRQRGISLEEAKKLQLSGFVSDIVNRITNETVRETVIEKVMNKLIKL